MLEKLLGSSGAEYTRWTISKFAAAASDPGKEVGNLTTANEREPAARHDQQGLSVQSVDGASRSATV